MPDETTVAQILAAEGITDYAQDLRQLSAAELLELFAFASSGKINATRVIKNLIWQAYTAIRDGHRAPIAGNLRSFWYTDIKPVLARLGVPVEGRRATELVYDAFVELVTRHHLFHYRDLGFLDEGAQTRAVGQAQTPPTHPFHHWSLKPTGFFWIKLPLGIPPFFGLISGDKLHRVVFQLT